MSSAKKSETVTSSTWKRFYNIDSLMRIKPLEKCLSQASTASPILSWYDLTAYGIAATIGSGVYVNTGLVARTAGPSVTISTLLAGLSALITAICYLEFASRVPTSGSAYVYAYNSMGEFAAWMIGWNLTLEYGICAAVIAVSWTDYLIQFIENTTGGSVPTFLSSAVGWKYMQVNIIATVIPMLVGLLVLRGLRSSARFSNIVTVLNISVIVFIIIAGSAYVNPGNWASFAPAGSSGIFTGAISMFFSFLGFDTVSTLSADAKNPKRDVPIAVIGTALTAIILYVLTGFVITGMVNYSEISEDGPLAQAFVTVGAKWASYIVGFCALTTMLATIFACIVGQPKIFSAMAKDGLLPPIFAKEDANGTPVISVLLTTFLVSIFACFFQETLGDMISFGCLIGFSVICAGLLILRFKNSSLNVKGPLAVWTMFLGAIITSATIRFTDHFAYGLVAGLVCVLCPFLALCYFFFFQQHLLVARPSGFVVPLMPILPSLAIFMNVFVASKVSEESFYQFLFWTFLGLVLYFTYGIRHSELGSKEQQDTEITHFHNK